MGLRRPLLSLSVLLALAACAPSRPAEPEAPRAAVTPNGEPLPLVPGPDGCRTALAEWFAKADANHDGLLDKAEMLADAERWFALADEDHNGEVTADELTAIRLRINPLPPLEPEPGSEDEGRHGRDMPARTHRRIQVDPVMAADANADFRVTAAEFRAYVEARPAATLSPAQVEQACRSGRD